MAVEAPVWVDLLQGEELAYLGSEPAREAQTAPLPEDLPTGLRESLEARGIDSLYSHQAETWEAAARGEHILVTTGTASGKSLAFNLPVLAALTEEPKLRALYLYPTKALAQDQVRALGELNVKNIRAAIYDGDTESEHRW
jgi:DEAD/DEAH box helicase domain-containing protein